MAARHKYLPSLSTTCHVNPKKETNGLKASFLIRLFCPDKIARLKGGHCRDHPQTHTWQHRKAFLYGTRGTSTLCPDSLRGAYGILKLIIRTTPLFCSDVLSGLSASVLTKNLGRKTQDIIVYAARSMLNRTLLGHFRQLVTTYTPPPAEQKDMADGKSSLPQSLTVTCRIMWLCHHLSTIMISQKVFPPSKETELLTL